MWGTPSGRPPKAPEAPPRGPWVSQSPGKNCKNSQKLYKTFTCIKIAQIITLTTPLLEQDEFFAVFGRFWPFLAIFGVSVGFGVFWEC